MEVGGVTEAPVVAVKEIFPGYDEYPEYAGAAKSEFPVNTSYSGPGSISGVFTHSSPE